jgi:ATP phosphoribosyltransferase regulatory subunit
MTKVKIAKDLVRAKAAELKAQFERKGALGVETDILLPADALLDLYGEDIRARAYVSYDPMRGEVMMRPDFTVPVVQRHMTDGADPARYTYAGNVFRKQNEGHQDRANEYMQVGFEVFDGSNPANADAEVFALFDETLAPLGLRKVTGDIGILTAAVRGLTTTEARRNALMRHIWRPRRFRALVKRFSEVGAEQREQTFERVRANMQAIDAPSIGLRSEQEILKRVNALSEDAGQPGIPNAEIELLNDILSLKETMPNVVSALRDIAVDLPAISPAVSALQARVSALDARGVDVENLDFETSFGRTSMEYYDGFVFGFYADAHPDLPAVATGGRYDALTAVLGQGRSIPAAGGVLRPDLILALQEAAQ